MVEEKVCGTDVYWCKECVAREFGENSGDGVTPDEKAQEEEVKDDCSDRKVPVRRGCKHSGTMLEALKDNTRVAWWCFGDISSVWWHGNRLDYHKWVEFDEIRISKDYDLEKYPLPDWCELVEECSCKEGYKCDYCLQKEFDTPPSERWKPKVGDWVEVVWPGNKWDGMVARVDRDASNDSVHVTDSNRVGGNLYIRLTRLKPHKPSCWKCEHDDKPSCVEWCHYEHYKPKRKDSKNG